jgi:D-alanine-D-alanine ligase
VESYLPGDEFTVGILGTGSQARVAGVLQVKLLRGAEPGVYSYMNKELCEERVHYDLVKNKKLLNQASSIALRAYNALNCRDAGRVDLKADVLGNLQFLEINPLAGLHPTHSDLPILCSKAGVAYNDLIKEIIDSAARRCHPIKMTDEKFWTSKRTSNLRLA